MDWSYVAGLFDGEGHPSISLRKDVRGSIQIRAVITNNDEKGLISVKKFLWQNNVYAGVCLGIKGKDENGWRKQSSYRLQISSNEGVEKFLENIYPFVVFKKIQCEIALKAIKLKNELKNNKKTIIHNLPLFDELRRELHKYSNKGPRILKSW